MLLPHKQVRTWDACQSWWGWQNFAPLCSHVLGLSQIWDSLFLRWHSLIMHHNMYLPQYSYNDHLWVGNFFPKRSLVLLDDLIADLLLFWLRERSFRLLLALFYVWRFLLERLFLGSGVCFVAGEWDKRSLEWEVSVLFFTGVEVLFILRFGDLAGFPNRSESLPMRISSASWKT